MQLLRPPRLAALVGVVLAAIGAAGCRDTQASSQAGAAAAAETRPPAELRLDWATYNISSVVLKRNGWLEQEPPIRCGRPAGS